MPSVSDLIDSFSPKSSDEQQQHYPQPPSQSRHFKSKSPRRQRTRTHQAWQTPPKTHSETKRFHHDKDSASNVFAGLEDNDMSTTSRSIPQHSRTLHTLPQEDSQVSDTAYPHAQIEVVHPSSHLSQGGGNSNSSGRSPLQTVRHDDSDLLPRSRSGSVIGMTAKRGAEGVTRTGGARKGLQDATAMLVDSFHSRRNGTKPSLLQAMMSKGSSGSFHVGSGSGENDENVENGSTKHSAFFDSNGFFPKKPWLNPFASQSQESGKDRRADYNASQSDDSDGLSYESSPVSTPATNYSLRTRNLLDETGSQTEESFRESINSSLISTPATYSTHRSRNQIQDTSLSDSSFKQNNSSQFYTPAAHHTHRSTTPTTQTSNTTREERYAVAKDERYLASPSLLSPTGNPSDEVSLAQFTNIRINDTFEISQTAPRRQTPSPSQTTTSQTKETSTTMDAQNEELHNLISAASSPTDPLWTKALFYLTQVSNPSHTASLPLAYANHWTCLHIACLSNPPLFFIYGLLLVHPNGVQETDEGGRLPLHLAAGGGASVAVLSCLVRHYKRGVSVGDDRGLIPLHLALLRGGGEVKGVELEEEEGEGEEMSMDVLRVLLGQSVPCREGGGGRGGRKVMDGGMRKGRHLELPLEDIGRGAFGESPDSLFQKERSRREKRLTLLKGEGGQERQDTSETISKEPKGQSLSRGFGILNHLEDDIDSQDGNPYTSPLKSLWEEEQRFNSLDSKNGGILPKPSKTFSDICGQSELLEVESFSEEVHQYLKLLMQWKRKRRIENGDAASSFATSEIDDGDVSVNPASIPAPPYMHLPLHMAIRRNHMRLSSQNLGQKSGKNDTVSNELSSLMKPHASQNDILRILIHAYPPALLYQDVNGRTPLLTCLQLSPDTARYPIDLEMIELLLGFRTVGFRVAPEWLDDVKFEGPFNSHYLQEQQLHQRYEKDRFGIGRSGIREKAYNPAMIASNSTLPLHVAAQESLDPSIIHAIYSCYPGAKYVQDERKCTPLFCALRNTTTAGNLYLNLEVMAMLLDEKVVRMRDDLNQSVFDLLVLNANSGRMPIYFPESDSGYGHKGLTSLENKSLKGASGHLSVEQRMKIYQIVFHNSILHDMENTLLLPSSTTEEELFLSKLFLLPPWLRRQACATLMVQRILLRQISKPFCTALILLYGVVLGVLVIVFLCLADEYASFLSQRAGQIGIQTMFTTTQWYKSAIYVSVGCIAFFELCVLAMALHLHTVWSQFLGNVWSWITVWGLALTLAATWCVDMTDDFHTDETLSSLSYIDTLKNEYSFELLLSAIIFLWGMVIGYIARWWYGVSFFCSGVIQMIQFLLPALLVFAIFTTAFMQVIYMVQGQSNQCLYPDNASNSTNTGVEGIDLCTIWKPYDMAFLFIMGELMIINHEDQFESKISSGMVASVLVFIILLFLLLLHTTVLSFRHGKSEGMKHATLDMYWSPMLTFIFFTRKLSEWFCCGSKSLKSNGLHGARDFSIQQRDTCLGRRQVCSAWEGRLEDTWDFLIASYSTADIKNTKWWFLHKGTSRSLSAVKIWLVRFLGFVLLPLWFITGLATLGILWPPQLRWWLFSSYPFGVWHNWEDESRTSNSSLDTLEASKLRMEISRLKAMMYERFLDVQSNIHDLRDQPFHKN